MNDNISNKIAFVILHYQNVDVTYECVKYLQALEEIMNHEIVIVDNASPNGTGKYLEARFDQVKNIHLIFSEKNRGFSSGNNIGYMYAREQLHIDIVVAMNSDVYIKDKCFIKKLLTFAKKNKQWSIVAPDIVVKNEFHQNPYMVESISTQVQKKILLKKVVGIMLYRLPVIGGILIKRKSVQDFQPNKTFKEEKTLENIVPHGSCLVFMPNWLKNEKFAFVEGTFLFVEEELLYDYCIDKGHTIVYCPNLIVNHMEDASQNAINKSDLEKKRNQMKYEIASRKLLLQKRKNKFKEG